MKNKKCLRVGHSTYGFRVCACTLYARIVSVRTCSCCFVYTTLCNSYSIRSCAQHNYSVDRYRFNNIIIMHHTNAKCVLTPSVHGSLLVIVAVYYYRGEWFKRTASRRWRERPKTDPLKCRRPIEFGTPPPTPLGDLKISIIPPVWSITLIFVRVCIIHYVLYCSTHKLHNQRTL